MPPCLIYTGWGKTMSSQAEVNQVNVVSLYLNYMWFIFFFIIQSWLLVVCLVSTAAPVTTVAGVLLFWSLCLCTSVSVLCHPYLFTAEAAGTKAVVSGNSGSNLHDRSGHICRTFIWSRKVRSSSMNCTDRNSCCCVASIMDNVVSSNSSNLSRLMGFTKSSSVISSSNNNSLNSTRSSRIRGASKFVFSNSSDVFFSIIAAAAAVALVYWWYFLKTGASLTVFSTVAEAVGLKSARKLFSPKKRYCFTMNSGSNCKSSGRSSNCNSSRRPQ